MPEMSEKYLDILLEVKGNNLETKDVNPLLRQYDYLLKECKVLEERSDGKVFTASVNSLDDRKHELIDKNTLICSRKIKFNIFNPFPHTQNNAEHHIYVLLHRKIMEIAVKLETKQQKIVIRTVDTHADGDFKKGRWPMTDVDKMFASLA